MLHVDGLMQERRNSIAIALELHLSCTKPWMYYSLSTDQRLDDIKYWQKEVDDKLDGLKVEIDNLNAFKTRVEKAIEACKEPLHIAQQCLVNRSVENEVKNTSYSFRCGLVMPYGDIDLGHHSFR